MSLLHWGLKPSTLLIFDASAFQHCQLSTACPDCLFVAAQEHWECGAYQHPARGRLRCGVACDACGASPCACDDDAGINDGWREGGYSMPAGFQVHVKPQPDGRLRLVRSGTHH